MNFELPAFDLDAFLTATLAEDLGDGGDITSAAVIPADARFHGALVSRDDIAVAGLPIAEAFFRRLDPDVAIEALVQDGDKVARGTTLMRIDGAARAMLTAERSALNTVQHLSGIATLTRTLCGRDRRHRCDPARHPQDHPRPARRWRSTLPG